MVYFKDLLHDFLQADLVVIGDFAENFLFFFCNKSLTFFLIIGGEESFLYLVVIRREIIFDCFFCLSLHLCDIFLCPFIHSFSNDMRNLFFYFKRYKEDLFVRVSFLFFHLLDYFTSHEVIKCFTAYFLMIFDLIRSPYKFNCP